MLVPVHVWATNLESTAREQAINLGRLPQIFRHVALMPDAHAGQGATIGSVFGCKDAIFPSAVGVDIGCGMCAIPTSVRAKKDITDRCGSSIIRTIPVGFSAHKEPKEWTGFDYESIDPDLTKEIQEEAPYKLGTLGGGNHFIEWQYDEDGRLWIMVHSGSRNVGLKIANHYIRKAKEQNPCEIDRNLAHLDPESEDGKNYIRDMQWALDYAYQNRLRMMYKVLEITQNIYEKSGIPFSVDMGELINIHHNYAAQETHYGELVWMHRKGATLAARGTIGIIPGSMGTGSFIVRGLGNPESFNSCSHGAGRKMGRKAAKERFTKKEVKRELEHAGVTCFSPSSDIRDESPGAYKDIGEVMENQDDLVEIAVHLKPLTVVKG